jgi:shikimate kinase
MTPQTRENIRRFGVSIWLKAELPVLLRRVAKKKTRPLLDGDPEGAMRRLMEARYPVYATADLTVESRDLPHDYIVSELLLALAAAPAVTHPPSVAEEGAGSMDAAS